MTQPLTGAAAAAGAGYRQGGETLDGRTMGGVLHSNLLAGRNPIHTSQASSSIRVLFSVFCFLFPTNIAP